MFNKLRIILTTGTVKENTLLNNNKHVFRICFSSVKCKQPENVIDNEIKFFFGDCYEEIRKKYNHLHKHYLSKKMF